MKFLIRASYPNYYMVNLYATLGQQPFDFDNEDKNNLLFGNKPGTVVCTRPDGTTFEYPPRWYDMYYLLKCRGDKQATFLDYLLREKEGEHIPQLHTIRAHFRAECQQYVASHPLTDNDELITTLTHGTFTDQGISHKGRMLLDLSRNCYPVPDFCILTAKLFNHPEHLEQRLEQAIANLETMTDCRLGDSHNPLVFAIRCAMPQYIPGLMPTILNIGVTRSTYEGLSKSHTASRANRVYLSTLHSISEMLAIEHKYQKNDIELSDEMQVQRICHMEQAICHASPEGERMLTDAHFQALRMVQYVRQFFIANQDLILTFMQGKQAHPSFILQRMVWTIGNNESYPGVLYSRHSRTGRGRQIESYRNIFGEEIMTGDVTSQDTAYFDRHEIKQQFPAVYHFDPLLKKLEAHYKAPVTIEFAVETRPHKVSLFSVLQLNMSEMTGRAALLSAIDMHQQHLIKTADVMDLIKPYHLRQIVSAAIDDSSLSQLTFFGKGLNVLPRTAISTVLCFSIGKAREMKARGEEVCLCQERFVPEDTITLNEVDAILSMAPAAIHVVTACRGYGIPAFMDLQQYGISKVGNSLVNSEGVVIHELDKITISSKRQTIYKGVAAFRPARFMKYLRGEQVELAPDEVEVFQNMKTAYERYQELVTSEKVTYISDIEKLARLIRCDLQNRPKVAREIVNSWYNSNADSYVQQVLESKMGSHQDQSRVFDLLDNSRKADFFRKATHRCMNEGLSGLKAGSFMLGRFVAKPIPRQVWNTLSDATVAFLLNEYVLYEKYLHVLEEVGEIKLARAHSRIETEGIDNMTIHNFDLTNFVPLLYSSHHWEHIAQNLELIEHQDNTHLLVELLSHPIEEIFDLSKPWKRAQIEELSRK